MVRRPERDGLQGVRTSLAWTRTSFAVVGNGVLFMAREVDRFHGPFRVVPVVLAGVVALVTYAAGRRRQRRLYLRPGSSVAPRTEVHLVGVAVLVLIAIACVTLPF